MSSQPVQLFSVSEYYTGTRREYTYTYNLSDSDITIHLIVYGETAKFVDMGYWETSSNTAGNIFEVQKKCKKNQNGWGNIIKINQTIWIEFRPDNTINLFDTNRHIFNGVMNYVEEESINMDNCDAIKID